METYGYLSVLVCSFVDQKFGDIDEHARNPEEEFDKLKDEMNEDSSQEKSEVEQSPEVKKKSSTPKVIEFEIERYQFTSCMIIEI